MTVMRLRLVPGRYVSAECLGGAHWACPGAIGVLHGGGVERLRCTCSATTCACRAGIPVADAGEKLPHKSTQA